MPREFLTVTPPQALSLDELQRFAVELQARFDTITEALARAEGLDGHTPTFANDVFFNGRRLCGVGRTRDDDDVPSRRELVENAMYRRHDIDAHIAKRLVVAERGIAVPQTTNPNLVAPFGQLAGLFVDTESEQTITGNKTNSGTQRNTGTSIFSGTLRFQASTPATLTADVDNYNLGSGVAFRLSSDAVRTITGLAGGVDGRVLLLVNVGANDIVLANQDLASTAENRIITGTGADVTLAANDTALLWYDDTTDRWRLVA